MVRFRKLTVDQMHDLRGRLRASGEEWRGELFDAAVLAGLEATPRQFVAIADGIVCAAGGIVPQLRGVAAAWFCSAGVPRRAWPIIVRRIRLELAAARPEFPRINAEVDAGNEAAVRFALKFGFGAAPTVLLTSCGQSARPANRKAA